MTSRWRVRMTRISHTTQPYKTHTRRSTRGAHASRARTSHRRASADSLRVTCHALNPTCVRTHAPTHLSYCFHLPGLLSNSTRPQIVYRARNIAHLRGNVRQRQMTQSPRMETRKQNRGGRTFPNNRAVTGMKEGYARQKPKEGHPSRGLVTRTIRSMLRYRFVMGMKMCFQLVLLSRVV